MKNQRSFSIVRFFIRTIIFTIFVSAALSAQEDNNDISIGNIVTVNSEILGEQRDIFIYLPIGYEQSSEKFPVIYVLDGRSKFFFSSAIVSFLSQARRMPNSIVIGIPNTNRMRDFTPAPFRGNPTTGGADKFLQFMEQELFPFVEKNYRVESFRTLYGHSLCGMFAVYTLFEKPEMFNAFIAVSPYLQFNDGYILDGIEAKLSGKTHFNHHLYITIGNEPDYFESLERMEDILSEKTANLSWTISERESEDHISVPLKSMYDGLEFIYSGWLLPNEVALKGVGAIKQHYAALSQKYGHPVKIDEFTANRIGYTFMQNNELEKAIAVFKYNVELYPESANVYDSLGEALESSGEIHAAAENYRAAVKFGELRNDPNLEIYKRNLERAEKGG